MAAVAALVSLGCGGGITEPKCERCDELRVVTDRPEYRPGSVISFTIVNRTTTPLRYDWCSVVLASRGNDDEFDIHYSPARRCGFGAGTAEVMERLVIIGPGESYRDSLTISTAANQSQYRLHLWLVDVNGVPEVGNPVVSNTFDIYPGASR